MHRAMDRSSISHTFFTNWPFPIRSTILLWSVELSLADCGGLCSSLDVWSDVVAFSIGFTLCWLSLSMVYSVLFRMCVFRCMSPDPPPKSHFFPQFSNRIDVISLLIQTKQMEKRKQAIHTRRCVVNNWKKAHQKNERTKELIITIINGVDNVCVYDGMC